MQWASDKSVAMTSPINSYFALLTVDELFPGPNVKTDEEIQTYLKQYLDTTYRMFPEIVRRFIADTDTNVAPLDTAGTTSMLPRELDGVVDAQLRTFLTLNLRDVGPGVLPL